jgi:polyisoprenoid-binding protein YceI
MPRSRLLAIALAVVLIGGAAGGAYGIWYLFLKPGGPPAVALSSANPGSTAAATATVSGASPASGEGTWTVDTSIGSFADFTSSFVGYRVQEQLATIGANIAVGRTPDVSGTLTVQGTSVTAVQISANLASLVSDDDRRDGQLRRQAIETDTYPTATFTLTTPIDLGKTPAQGAAIHVDATGDLTLHGVTRPVTIPLDARLSGGVVEVTGSLPIVFADYGIQKPTSFIVLSVADEGTMELQLFFTQT